MCWPLWLSGAHALPRQFRAGLLSVLRGLCWHMWLVLPVLCMLASVAGAARAMHLWIFTRPLIWSTMSMRHLGFEAWNLDFMMRQVNYECAARGGHSCLGGSLIRAPGNEEELSAPFTDDLVLLTTNELHLGSALEGLVTTGTGFDG